MFEWYTEKARRVIFFARYEASQFGSPYIESEHLLLGILREDKALTNRFLGSHASVESIRSQIEAHTVIREKVSTSVDLPVSSECKRVLAYAAEEAERLGHKHHLGTEHLLLGLLREEGSFAAQILNERGVQLASAREDLARAPEAPASQAIAGPTSLNEHLKDLTQLAANGQLEPISGREVELEAVIEILCSRDQRNPLLIGERGAGKTAIVELLAQRIVEGQAPPSLAEKRIVVVDPELLVGLLTGSQAAKTLIDPARAILFLDGVKDLQISSGRAIGSGAALRQALAFSKLQSIAVATLGEMDAASRIPECFRAVYVRPLDAEATLRVLQARKAGYERVHEVTYANDALELAVQASGRYLRDRPFPGKALELIDAAGARVKMRQVAPPAEIAEVLKRIKFIVQKTESAILNHEFEKARFYSDEERKERENLRVLREKYPVDEATSVVTREDIEEVITRWADYPFQP